MAERRSYRLTLECGHQLDRLLPYDPAIVPTAICEHADHPGTLCDIVRVAPIADPDDTAAQVMHPRTAGWPRI